MIPTQLTLESLLLSVDNTDEGAFTFLNARVVLNVVWINPLVISPFLHGSSLIIEVRVEGVEPSRDFSQRILSPVRLPIPPYPQ